MVVLPMLLGTYQGDEQCNQSHVDVKVWFIYRHVPQINLETIEIDNVDQIH